MPGSASHPGTALRVGLEYTVACNAPPGANKIVELLDDAIVGLDRG